MVCTMGCVTRCCETESVTSRWVHLPLRFVLAVGILSRQPFLLAASGTSDQLTLDTSTSNHKQKRPSSAQSRGSGDTASRFTDNISNSRQIKRQPI